MKETELKPCPFCGGKAEFNIGQVSFYDNISVVREERYELRVSVELRCTQCHMSEGRFTACIGINPDTAETRHSVYDTISVERMARRWNRRADNEQRAN